MATHVVILGAGFGGLELSSRLSAEVAEDVEITLIDGGQIVSLIEGRLL